MRDKIELKIIELQRAVKQFESVLSDENASQGEIRNAHVEKISHLFAINQLYQLLIQYP